MARARIHAWPLSAYAAVVLVSAFAIFLCRPLAAPAQDLRAAISGTVTDPSGAPVPDANVLITDTDRGVKFPVVTNQAGRYASGPLVPSHYSVAVEAKGFKKFERTNVLLQLSEQAGVDVHLELGAVNQTVTVTTTAPILDTENANRTGTVTPEMVRDLPNNGRDVFNLVFSMPGAYQPCTCISQQVTITGSGHASFEISGTVSAGGRQGNNGVLIDGTSDANGTSTLQFQPALYAVDQVQVKTNTYDAQYGRTGGGYAAFTTKAGTDQYHGILFERFNSSALTANSWLNDSSGKPKIASHSHNYGFEVGGPVIIPKVFDGRGKLFAMLSLDHWPQTGTSASKATVPTAAERQGNFAGVLDSKGDPLTIYDPNSTVLQGTTYVRTPFASNAIPSGRINGIGQALVNMYPMPNVPGTGPAGTNNYFGIVNTSDDITQWLGRMDYVMSDRNRFYGSFGKTDEMIVQPGTFTGVLGNGTSYPGTNNTEHGVLDWTSTISPTMTLDLRVGFSRDLSGRNNSFAAGYDPTKLGFPAALVSQFYQLQFPTITMSPNDATFGPSQVNTDSTNNVLDAHADMAKSQGKHFLRMGAEYIQYGVGSVNSGFASGNYAFNPQWTQANPTQADIASGNEAADLLLGLPTSGYVDRNANPYWESHDWALYFQDDWKVSHRLSLNLGIRWDYTTPVYEEHNRIVDGFAFGAASPIAAAVAAAPGVANCPACAHLTGGLTFGSANSPYAWQPDHSGFTPRIGVAYQLDQKTVLRGGFGMFTPQAVMNQTGPLIQGFSVQTPLVASLDGNITPAITLGNPFPNGLLTPSGSSLGLSTLLGTSVGFPTQNFPNSYSYQWSLGLQRELPGNVVLEASYVGNKITNFPIGLSGNAIPTANLGQPASYYSQKVTNPFVGLLPSNASLNGATIARQFLMTPYPQFSGLSGSNVPIGWSRYDAMEATVTRRFAHGTSIMVNYTISKNLIRMSALNNEDYNPVNPWQSVLEERLATFDVPQKVDVLGTYELPVGHGQRFGSTMPKVLNAAVGGWMLSGNVTVQSGFPVPYPNNAAIAPGSAAISSGQSYLHWFNTSLFPNTAFPAFTYRTFPSYFPDVRFMGDRDVELGLMKDFQIYERLKFRMRADFSNAFNHPYFTTLASSAVNSAQFGQLNIGGGQNNSPRAIFLEGNLIF